MKRIQKARIQFLTLCPRGKNRMPVLYKDDGTIEFDTVIKASEDAGELTVIIYPVERVDADGHLASAEVIKEMAYDAAKRGLDIDIRHDGKPVGKDRAYVAEHFIVQKGDPRFVDWKDYDDNLVDATDAWASVIKIDDPELRRLYREGEWDGVSMQGTGLLTVEKADETDGLLQKFLKALGLKSPTNDEDVDMKKQELEEILKADRKDLVTELVKAIKTEPKPEPKTDGKPGEVKKEDEVKLDLTDAKAVREHAEKLEKEEAAKNFDMTDPKAVRELADKLAKEEAAKIEKAEADDSDEVKKLKADLRKAEGRSNAPASDEDEKNESYEDFTKEEAAGIKIGSRMAASNNEAAGYKA